MLGLRRSHRNLTTRERWNGPREVIVVNAHAADALETGQESEIAGQFVPRKNNFLQPCCVSLQILLQVPLRKYAQRKYPRYAVES